MTLSLLAFFSFIAGLIIFAVTEKKLPQELGRMLMWCGFLVLLFEIAGWHGVTFH